MLHSRGCDIGVRVVSGPSFSLAASVTFREMTPPRLASRLYPAGLFLVLSLATCATGVAASTGDVTLKLGRSYVGGIYPKELASGTVGMTPPSRWSFVRDTTGHIGARYSIPVSTAACVPQGELRVVGVQATGTDPLKVARQHAFKGVIASGRLHSGAWAVVRYRTAPSRVKSMLGGVAVLRIAHHGLLTVQTRLRSTCALSTSDLDRIAGELGKSVRSARPHVRIRRAGK